VVVDQFDITSGSILEPENDPPIRADCHRPIAFAAALERMEAIPREVQRLRTGGSVKDGQNPLDRIHQIRANAASISPLIQPAKTAVLETADHENILH
jgi:hypothetical protein